MKYQLRMNALVNTNAVHTTMDLTMVLITLVATNAVRTQEGPTIHIVGNRGIIVEVVIGVIVVIIQ
jgi:hypothetical protein